MDTFKVCSRKNIVNGSITVYVEGVVVSNIIERIRVTFLVFR